MIMTVDNDRKIHSPYTTTKSLRAFLTKP
jgi:hypothetical protein